MRKILKNKTTYLLVALLTLTALTFSVANLENNDTADWSHPDPGVFSLKL